MKQVYVVLIILLIAGCAVQPGPVPTKPADPETSAIGIQIKIEYPVGWGSWEPTRVYFVKIDDEGDIIQDQVIPSNFAKDGRIYLLNAEPGKYAAVVSHISNHSGRQYPGGGSSATATTYFSKELIEATKVNVGLGEFAFMGSYVVKTLAVWNWVFADPVQYDPVQDHYRNLVRPTTQYSVCSIGSDSRRCYYGRVGEAKRDDDTRAEFISSARDDLAEGGWESILK